MHIISIDARPNGGRSPLQSWNGETPPEGYVLIPDEMDVSVFAEFKGFVNITHDGTQLLTMTGNQTAYDAEFPPATAEELLAQARAAALERIDGKCSVAIFVGIDYGDKHYGLSENQQNYIRTAYAEVQAGATTAILAADGELPNAYAAATVTGIYEAAMKRMTTHINYHSYLYAWIEQATDKATLEAIEYGSELPTAYKNALLALLSTKGITAAEVEEILG